MIPWLIGDDPFPAVERALVQPNGLLAAGADLSPERLIAAYRRGIFPWFSEGEPILWWSPDPRMVVFPAEFHASHSLRKRLRQGHYEVRLDSSFTEIMEACSAPRRHPGGTWISPAMKVAYARLFQLGYAHCVETWMDGELVGGLYGVALGRVFFGESMFARRTDASKIAFAHLVGWLERHDFSVIDCQMNTSHLASLGGREIPRARFCQLLAEGVDTGFPSGRWPAGGATGMYTGARQADPA